MSGCAEVVKPCGDANTALAALRPAGYTGAVKYDHSGYTMHRGWAVGIISFLILFIIVFAALYATNPTWAQYQNNGVATGQPNGWILFFVSIIIALILGALIGWALSW